MIISILCMRMLNLEKLSNFPITHTKKVAKLGIWARSTKPGIQYSTHNHFRKWSFKYEDSNNYLISMASVQFNCSVVSDSLWPHGLQQARLPSPSPTPRVTQTHVHWIGDAIQPSHPLSSPSPPTFNLSQHQSLSNESVLCIRGQSIAYVLINAVKEH